MKLLIADDESSVLELLKLNAQTEWPIIEILTAQDGQEAKTILEKEEFQIPVVICDYSMPNMNGGEVFNLIQEKNPSIKFVLCSARQISEIPEFKNASPYFHIEKPDIAIGIKKLSEKMMRGLLDQSSKEMPPDFLPVTLSLLEKAGSCPCPIFLKLSDNKFLRIFQKQDPFTKSDVEKYQKKKIENLFILREDLDSFSKYLESTLAHFIKEKSEGMNPSEMSHMHEMGLQFFKLPFMTDEQVELTNQWVNTTQKFFTTQKNQSIKDQLKSLLNNSSPEFINHLNLCTYFSIELARTLSWTNDSTLFKLTMASLLHDVALQRDEAIEFSPPHEDWKKFPISYRQHAKDSASLVQMMRDVPPDVDRIIQEHHELPDGSGFPRGLKGNQISPLSSIFILAHALALVTLNAKGDLSLEKKVLLAKIPNYFYDYSPWKELLRDYALN